MMLGFCGSWKGGDRVDVMHMLYKGPKGREIMLRTPLAKIPTSIVTRLEMNPRLFG